MTLEIAQLESLNPIDLARAVVDLDAIVTDCGMYLAGSPHPEDHQVAAAMEQRQRSALKEIEHSGA